MIEGLLTPMHLLLILAVALVVLGPKRLPEAGRGLGSAIRGFKESLSTPASRDEPLVVEQSHEPDHPAQGVAAREPHGSRPEER